MGGTRLWGWGLAEFGWVARGFGAGHAEFGWVARLARGSGAGSGLDGWNAALELGTRGVWIGGTRLWSWRPAEFGWMARDFGAEFGWLARGSGAGGLRAGAGGPRFWMVGTWRGPVGFGWVARGFGAGGPRNLDGWHAANALGFSAQIGTNLYCR